MKENEHTPNPGLLRLIGSHLALRAQVQAIEELSAKAAEHLPESMLGGMSPALFLKKRQKDYLEQVLPYFSGEVRGAIEEALKHCDGVEDSIAAYRRWLKEQEES